MPGRPGVGVNLRLMLLPTLRISTTRRLLFGLQGLCAAACLPLSAGAGMGASPPDPGVSSETAAAASDLKNTAAELNSLGADLTNAASALTEGHPALSTAPDSSAGVMQTGVGALWSMAAGGPDRTGAYASPIEVSRLALAWQFPTRIHPDAISQPIVAGDEVYFVAGSEVRAVSVPTGTLAWKLSLPRAAGETAVPAAVTSPVYAGGWLYVGASDNKLYAIDASSGAMVEQLPLDAAPAAAPLVANGVLFLATAQGMLHAYHLPSGRTGNLRPLWSVQLTPADTFSVPLAVLGSSLYAAGASGRIFGVNCATGVVFAKADLGSAGGVQGLIPTAAGVLVASGRSLYSLSPQDLGARWAHSYPSPIAVPPAYAAGTVYVVTTAGVLYATSPSPDAGNSWSVDLGSSSGSQPVVIVGDVVIAVSRGRVYAFAAQGNGAGHHRLLWQYGPPAPPDYAAANPWLLPDIQTPLAVQGSELYIFSSAGILTCLSTNARDNTGPVVDLRYPQGGGYAAGDISGIVARVQDRESGYLRGSLKLVVDGAPVRAGYVYDPDTGRLTYTPPELFQSGLHTVEVMASDNRHNWSDTRWSFVVAPAKPGDPSTAPTTYPPAAIPARNGNTVPHGFSAPGVPDFTPNYVRELKPPTRWLQFPLNVYFIRDADYTPEREHAAVVGFNRWVMATDSVINYRVVAEPAQANVTVRFDPAKWDGVTYTESVSSHIRRANISLGVALPGNRSQPMPMIDLECVAAHEFGHTLGINGHSSDPGDVMYFQHTVGHPWTLTQRDLNTLRSDYAPLFGGSLSGTDGSSIGPRS